MTVSFDQMSAIASDGRALRFVHIGDPKHPNQGCSGCAFAKWTESPCGMSQARVCLSYDRKDEKPGGIWILA